MGDGHGAGALGSEADMADLRAAAFRNGMANSLAGQVTVGGSARSQQILPQTETSVGTSVERLESLNVTLSELVARVSRLEDRLVGTVPSSAVLGDPVEPTGHMARLNGGLDEYSALIERLMETISRLETIA